MNGRRADLLLVERGFYESRARARAAIEAGLVRIAGRLVRRPAEAIDADEAAIEALQPHPYASRGGVKLSAALDRFGVDVAGRCCLDVGASTGGFSDVLLQRGAAGVVAVDVGRGQLHPRLAGETRLTLLEATDARRLTAADLGAPPDILVCDVSFISLTLILPTILPLAAGAARLVALVKPQFESTPADVVKGLVRDPAARERAAARVEGAIAALGWLCDGRMDSPIAGGDGNREYLVAATGPA